MPLDGYTNNQILGGGLEERRLNSAGIADLWDMTVKCLSLDFFDFVRAEIVFFRGQHVCNKTF